MDAHRFATHSLNDPRILRILAAAIEAVDPYMAVKKHLPNLAGSVHGLGIGKASIPMLTALAEAYPLSGALAISKHASGLSRGLFPVIEGGHPIPNENSLRAGKAALEFVASLREDDTLVCLISGGGSALMTAPHAGISLEDMQTLTSLLLSCGARIDEINVLRRRLDRVKGGGLARATKAKVVSLILSDVIGNPLEAIASGPTFPDPTTSEDALAILKKYGIEKQIPSSIFHFLTSMSLRVRQGRSNLPVDEEIASLGLDTPSGDGCSTFARNDNHVRNIIIGDNRLAARAALEQAKREGFHGKILTHELQGEAREVGRDLAYRLRIGISKEKRPFCWIAGGETTVTIRGSGKGGRNQELALAAVDELNSLENAMLISLATDGEDGPTDAAGAVVTGETSQRAERLRLRAADHLSRNDAYPFFDALGDLIRCGPTGTNVNDLAFLLGL